MAVRRENTEGLKIDLPYDTAISLLGIYTNKVQIALEKVTCNVVFITAQSTKRRHENNLNTHGQRSG